MRMTRRDRDIADARRAMRDTMEYLDEAKASSRDSSGDLKKSAAKSFVEAAEVGLGAAAVGLAAGRLGSTGIGGSGVPLGLTLGVLGHAAAAFGVTGKYADHVQNVSNGAIAGWLTLWGAGQGGQWRAKSLGEASNGAVIGSSRSDHGSRGLDTAVGAHAPSTRHAHPDRMGAAPVYPSAPAPKQFMGMNPFAASAVPGYGAAYGQRMPNAPLSEAELQAMSRDMYRP